MESVLGCNPRRTSTEEKAVFHKILQNVIVSEDTETNTILMEIQQNLSDMVEEHNTIFEKEPVYLTNNIIQEIIADVGISEEVATKIQQACTEEFGGTPPEAQNVIDEKALVDNARKMKEKELQKQLFVLKQQLEESKPNEMNELDSNTNSIVENYDIVLKVNPQKVPQIKTQTIDGKKCIVIPLDENELTNINGVETMI